MILRASWWKILPLSLFYRVPIEHSVENDQLSNMFDHKVVDLKSVGQNYVDQGFVKSHGPDIFNMFCVASKQPGPRARSQCRQTTIVRQRNPGCDICLRSPENGRAWSSQNFCIDYDISTGLQISVVGKLGQQARKAEDHHLKHLEVRKSIKTATRLELKTTSARNTISKQI